MPDASLLVDTNVLLRWVKPDDRDYPLVVSAIDRTLQRGVVPCYTSQNVAEFWNTCTRPLDRNGFGITPAEADRRAALFEARFQLLVDNLAVHQEWRKLLITHNVRHRSDSSPDSFSRIPITQPAAADRSRLLS
jgi:hypothetical protein